MVAAIPIALVGGLYARGIRALWSRPGGRGVVHTWEAAAFAAGIAVLVVALSGPVDALAHERLSAHMIQHVLLVSVAAPLLALGRPLLVLAPDARSGAGRMLHRVRTLSVRARISPAIPLTLLVVTAMHLGVISVWHLPVLYDAALTAPWIHAVEHGMFITVSLWLWMTLLRRERRARLGYGSAVICLVVLMIGGGALGALLTFAEQPLYATYAGGGAGALTAVEDQQIAGLLMWVPAGLVYALAALVLFVQWLRAIEHRAALIPTAPSADVPAPPGEPVTSSDTN